MKSIFIFFVFLISTVSYSQVDRSIGQGQYKIPKSNEKFDPIESSVEYLKKELDLNGFQEAVVKTYVVDYQSRLDSVMEEQIPYDGKKIKISALFDKLNNSIFDILEENQKDKFNEYLKKSKKQLK